MAKESREKLKSYFQTGDQPTEQEFVNWFDSTVMMSGSNSITGSLIISGSPGDNTDGTPVMLHVMGNITSSGNISASGTIYADNFQSTGGDVAGINFTDDLAITGHITASGNISSSGNILADIYKSHGTNAIAFSSNNIKVSETYPIILNHSSTTATNITASGNISASGILYGDSLYIDNQPAVASNVGEIVLAHGSLNLKSFAANNNFAGHITSSGNISSSGTLIVQKNQFLKTTNTAANHQGDVVFFGGTTSMTAGTIYYYNSSGNWVQTDADAESSAKGLLAVALGTASDTDGMLLRGTVTLSHDPGTIGDVLYLSTTTGQASSTVPSGNTDIVRIVGYCLDSSNNQIWFNPDNTFVEVSA